MELLGYEIPSDHDAYQIGYQDGRYFNESFYSTLHFPKWFGKYFPNHPYYERFLAADEVRKIGRQCGWIDQLDNLVLYKLNCNHRNHFLGYQNLATAKLFRYDKRFYRHSYVMYCGPVEWLDYEGIKRAVEWCRANADEWYICHGHLYFTSRDDLVLFRLAI